MIIDARRHAQPTEPSNPTYELVRFPIDSSRLFLLQVTITYKPGGEDVVEAHGHEDYDHEKWFSAFTPQVWA